MSCDLALAIDALVAIGPIRLCFLRGEYNPAILILLPKFSKPSLAESAGHAPSPQGERIGSLNSLLKTSAADWETTIPASRSDYGFSLYRKCANVNNNHW